MGKVVWKCKGDVGWGVSRLLGCKVPGLPNCPSLATARPRNRETAQPRAPATLQLSNRQNPTCAKMHNSNHMPENILVVEYEPRYTDRVKLALTGQPFEAWFAKDGDEALRVVDAVKPGLIILSSVVPRMSTSDLIRSIRGRDSFKRTPILVTVS